MLLKVISDEMPRRVIKLKPVAAFIIEIIQATIATILSGKATMVASVVHAAINSFPKSKRQ
ncbi:MAG TPA: hypothetical protein DCW74_19780 [Alteromonas australica]|jgi:hypothetical protein|uniref:Uncharacterized protein n=1 Tax=Alteromonas australica TaxID=589873 RepID=A0A358E0E4_9ALTE|nr:hypothetical protein [Alteromonas sp.]HAI71403.1 hypothetical protein [Alteromonas australica]HAU26619.1 hypothetical protein [Alteromonas australica]HAW77962.1 hypothetical protein [Alteromonas australica]HBU51880.1 hypothetical protein [Alteromonas australica]|tara:strand:- start:394 stop:576 length:183 start_codon:yes stop_codon:yes gene_type:complete